jgi:hypothetical protein
MELFFPFFPSLQRILGYFIRFEENDVFYCPFLGTTLKLFWEINFANTIHISQTSLNASAVALETSGLGDFHMIQHERGHVFETGPYRIRYSKRLSSISFMTRRGSEFIKSEECLRVVINIEVMIYAFTSGPPSNAHHSAVNTKAQ